MSPPRKKLPFVSVVVVKDLPLGSVVDTVAPCTATVVVEAALILLTTVPLIEPSRSGWMVVGVTTPGPTFTCPVASVQPAECTPMSYGAPPATRSSKVVEIEPLPASPVRFTTRDALNGPRVKVIRATGGTNPAKRGVVGSVHSTLTVADPCFTSTADRSIVPPGGTVNDPVAKNVGKAGSKPARLNTIEYVPGLIALTPPFGTRGSLTPMAPFVDTEIEIPVPAGDVI